MKWNRWLATFVGATGLVAMGLIVGASSAGASATWAYHPIPTGVNTLTGVSCPTISNCVAVGSGTSGSALALFSDDGGATWTEVMLPNGSGPLSSVSCPSTSDCVAVGLDDTFFSTDGGAIWTEGTGGGGDAISCPSTTDCVAVEAGTTPGVGIMPAPSDYQIANVTTNGGSTWATTTLPVTPSGFDSVSCGSPSDCVVIGGNGFQNFTTVSTNGGSTWSPAAQISSSGGGSTANAVSCTSTGDCVAVGNTGFYSTDGGSTWSFSTVFNANDGEGGGYSGVSCTTANECVAVGSGPISTNEPGATATAIYSNNGGATWTPQTNTATSGFSSLNSVSCASTSICVATATDSQGRNAVLTENEGSHGYWLVGSDGGIFSFGSAQFYGSTGALTLQRPVVGITPTSDDGGYWLVASDGGIFSFGNAGFYGSIPGLGIAPAGSSNPDRLNAPIVGMVPSSDGRGYFMVGADGGVFTFGDAKFEGSCPGIGGCSGTAVAVVPDASGNGYWLVTANGNVSTFGDATDYGAPASPSASVTAAVRTPTGDGYWILFSNGVVDAFGDAANLGSAVGAVSSSNPATAIFATSDGEGYWIATAYGSVFTYGDVPYDGSMAGTHLNGPIIAGTGW